MFFFVLLQELHQGLHALPGHGVVDGRPQAAHALVALQVVEARGLAGGHHVSVLLLAGGHEGHVHQGAVFLDDGAGEELALVQEVVEDLRLLLVPGVHGLQAALVQQVPEHLAAAVDGPAVGGVVHGAVVGVGLVAQIGGDALGKVVPDQILPDDDHRHAGGTHVLLHARPDQAVLAHVAGTGEEHGGLVGDQGGALGVGELKVGGAVDGLVLADIDIVGVVRDVQVGAFRHVGEVLVGGGGDNLHLAVLLGLADGLLGPGAGLHIAAHAVFHQVHGHHGKLHSAAALDEEHLIVVGDAHELAKVRLSLVNDLLEHFGAMAHLHDAHAASAVVHHFGGDLLQDFLRHHSGAGREIVCSVVLHN